MAGLDEVGGGSPKLQGKWGSCECDSITVGCESVFFLSVLFNGEAFHDLSSWCLLTVGPLFMLLF